MAINVNEVYKTVLLILNKEQRGYITPDEFGKIGTQVQLEIFEKYFEDLNQQLRVRQDETEYADRVKNIDDKISIFKTVGDCIYSTDHFTLPTDYPVHRIGTVMYTNRADIVEVERVQKNELIYQKLSPLTKPSKSFPVYLYEDDTLSPTSPKIYIEPKTINNNISVSYIRKPANARWGFQIGGASQYVYDSTIYTATGLPTITDYLQDSLTQNFGSPIGFNGATFTNLTLKSNGVTYSGNGGDLLFDMVLTGDGNITSLTTTQAGSGFAVGDTITLDASVFQASALTPGTINAVITLTESSMYSGTTFGSTQFEIDNTDQSELILNILKYCGVVIRDPQIIQSATQLAMVEDQNEKS